MKKFLAIALLSLFGMTSLPGLLAALSAGSVSETRLPACCRRNGSHRCMAGLAAESGSETSGAKVEKPLDLCPYFPAATGSVWHGAALASVGEHTATAPRAGSVSLIETTLQRSRSQLQAHLRGPPPSPLA